MAAFLDSSCRKLYHSSTSRPAEPRQINQGFLRSGRKINPQPLVSHQGEIRNYHV
jgi:hypothetical protein